MTASRARRRARTLRPTGGRSSGYLGLGFPLPTASPAVMLGAATAGWVVGGLGLALLVAGVAAAGCLFAARRAVEQRAAAVDVELADVLDGMVRSLRAGASLEQAVTAARPGGASLLATDWDRLVRTTSAIGLAGGLEEWVRACPRPSVRLAAGALALAAETGGAQARAIDGVSRTLRERLAVEADIRAQSAQARLSAAVLAIAPLGFAVVAVAADPRLAEVYGSPGGLLLVTVALALDAAGAWWMARLCRAPR